MTLAAIKVAAVVVHHKSVATVLDTTQAIIESSIGLVVVVDNSEDSAIRADLRRRLPTTVVVLSVPNNGYGAAANMGISHVLSIAPEVESLLISSHESLPEPGAIDLLVDALAKNPSLGVVAPVLSLAGPKGQTWSTGGQLGRWTLRPLHSRGPVGAEAIDCEWVDGAFALYRVAALEENRFDELYFMYYEETDLHRRIAIAGWRIAVIPQARATQSTGGAPAYYVGRNSVIFTRRYGTPLQLALHICRESARILIRGDGNRTKRRPIVAYLRGVRDGWVAEVHIK